MDITRFFPPNRAAGGGTDAPRRPTPSLRSFFPPARAYFPPAAAAAAIKAKQHAKKLKNKASPGRGLKRPREARGPDAVSFAAAASAARPAAMAAPAEDSAGRHTPAVAAGATATAGEPAEDAFRSGLPDHLQTLRRRVMRRLVDKMLSPPAQPEYGAPMVTVSRQTPAPTAVPAAAMQHVRRYERESSGDPAEDRAFEASIVRELIKLVRAPHLPLPVRTTTPCAMKPPSSPSGGVRLALTVSYGIAMLGACRRW
eukprot:COSAG05_NODE_1583_length_4488_cov_2.012303_4_plen_256_part_00